VTSTTTVPGAARPPGRPRSAEAHRAILDAAIAAFVEEGFEGMSIEGVAARAGVGKTTIYRRWPSKEDLVIDAINELIFDVEPPDTGSVREDLVEMLVIIQTIMTSSPAGEIFPRMAAQVAAGSPLGLAYLKRVIEPRFAILQAMIARGVERGELPADADPHLLRALLIGPVLMWKLLGRLSRRGVRRRAEHIVDTVLAGIRTRAEETSASRP
jgi:AcrR family transcriptional regulator